MCYETLKAKHIDNSPLALHNRAPHILVEALTGDFAGNFDGVSLVARSGLDVYAHNVETVEAMTPFVRDRRANFRQSLRVLEYAKKEGVKVTKTSIMLGVGETEDQVLQTLKGTIPLSLLKMAVCSIGLSAPPPFFVWPLELRNSDVDVVTFGQYMRPTKKHMKVDRYVMPAEFDRWKEVAEDLGFLYVASGPLVRSSYKVRHLVRVVWRRIRTQRELLTGGRVLYRELPAEESQG